MAQSDQAHMRGRGVAMRDAAKWIWHTHHEYDLVNSWMEARRTLRLAKVPRRAEVCVTADSGYRLLVNGRAVARGPARGFQASWPFDRVDLAPHLRRGRNTIEALVHCLGVGTFGYYHEGTAGFLLWGKVGGEVVSTGPQWQVRAASGYRRVLTRLSIELGFQEHFDARAEESSWREPVMRAFGGMPWHDLEERGIPLLLREPCAPVAVAATAEGRSGPGWRDAADVVRLLLSEKRVWRAEPAALVARDGFATIEIPAAGAGRCAAFVLDFGEEVVGHVRLRAEGAAGGEVVDTIAVESLEGAAPAIAPVEAGSRCAMGNRLVLEPGTTDHEAFDPFGLRYLVVLVRGAAGPLRLSVGLTRTGYPLAVRGAFACSDDTLNRVWDISVRAQRCCMLDAYVDCPWREQAQWWGDARVQAKNTFHLAADARLLARGIRQLGAQEVPNGLTYGVAPNVSHRCILPDFSLVWLMTHRDYHWQTGDVGLFGSMLPRVRRVLGYFEDARAKNGLLPFDPRYWLFLDWHPIVKEGYPTLYNLLYLMALDAAAEMFGLAGESADAARCRALRAQHEGAVLAHLYDPVAGSFAGGLDAAGRRAGRDTIHAVALAVLLDLLPGRREAFVAERLVPLVRGPLTDPAVPSPFFMFYVFEALKAAGRGAEVVDCIRRWWGDMVRRGLTTTEEVWNARPGRESLCHAWSAHPIVHFANLLLGVTQAAPGWREVRFAPEFETLTRASGKVATPFGPIAVAWRKVRGETRVRLALPPGVSAAVRLPGVAEDGIRGRRDWVLID